MWPRLRGFAEDTGRLPALPRRTFSSCFLEVSLIILFTFKIYPLKSTFYCLWVCVCVCCFSPVRFFYDPMDCSPPRSSVLGILQARILEQVVMPSSRWSVIFLTQADSLPSEPPGKLLLPICLYFAILIYMTLNFLSSVLLTLFLSQNFKPPFIFTSFLLSLRIGLRFKNFIATYLILVILCHCCLVAKFCLSFLISYGL